jgi:hypothetical protein
MDAIPRFPWKRGMLRSCNRRRKTFERKYLRGNSQVGFPARQCAPGCRIDKGNTRRLLLLIVTQQEWEKQIEQVVKKQIETWL